MSEFSFELTDRVDFIKIRRSQIVIIMIIYHLLASESDRMLSSISASNYPIHLSPVTRVRCLWRSSFLVH